MERGLKVIVLTIVSFCLLAAQPSLARETHGHHSHHASAKGAPTRHAGTAKRTNSIGTSPNDTIDMGVTVLSPRSDSTLDKSRDEKPSLRITKPENFQAHRAGVPGPSIPVARNSIGQPVNPALDTTDGAKHSGPKLQTPDVNSSVRRTGVARQALGEPNVGLHIAGPVASVGIPNRSKIGGAGLIRPAFAPSGLGGPAKAVAGINGTTFRSKH